MKSNQHAEKNNSLSWHQTQHSLPCSYQTLNYLTNNSWKPQTRHLASSPLSQEEIIKKKKIVAVNSNSVNSSASSSQVWQDSLWNNDSSCSHPPTPWRICSTKKMKNVQQKKYREEIGLGKRLKHLLRFRNVTKYCIRFHCQTTKIKSRLLLNKIAEQLPTNEKNVSKKIG